MTTIIEIRRKGIRFEKVVCTMSYKVFKYICSKRNRKKFGNMETRQVFAHLPRNLQEFDLDVFRIKKLPDWLGLKPNQLGVGKVYRQFLID